MNHHGSTSLSVSVIIPAYNCARFIEAAVSSATNQTRKPDEVIVVDDGSTDGTDRVLKQLGPPVRVIHQANAGVAAARNTGLRAAQGDLIAFLDGDDMLTPDSIERRVTIFESSPDVGVVYGDMYVVDADGEALGGRQVRMPGPRPSGFVLAELAARSFILIPAMVRRSALGAHLFDESLDYCEDYDFWRRLAATCRFQYCGEPVAYYRIHDVNMSVAQPTKINECELLVQERIFQMPQFQQLTRRQKTRAYCHHGVKNAAIGRTAAAAQSFGQAVSTLPFSPTGHVLMLLNLVAPRLLSYIIWQRRRVFSIDLASVAPGARAARAPGGCR